MSHIARWSQKWNGTNENCVVAPPTCPGALKRCDFEPDMVSDGVSKIKENNLPISILSHDNAPENLLHGHICHCTLSTKEQMTAVTNNHRGFSNHSIRRNRIVMTKEWF
ncbi:hypothetical protein V490_08311 [Pseudogymnoascus sp. VKM F-3557]|nr:hypothetical protein V490_08311 [Pseudogymnoascus sp. VKM F-3557]